MLKSFWILCGGDYGGVVAAREIPVTVKEVDQRLLLVRVRTSRETPGSTGGAPDHCGLSCPHKLVFAVLNVHEPPHTSKQHVWTPEWTPCRTRTAPWTLASPRVTLRKRRPSPPGTGMMWPSALLQPTQASSTDAPASSFAITASPRRKNSHLDARPRTYACHVRDRMEPETVQMPKSPTQTTPPRTTHVQICSLPHSAQMRGPQLGAYGYGNGRMVLAARHLRTCRGAQTFCMCGVGSAKQPDIPLQ